MKIKTNHYGETLLLSLSFLFFFFSSSHIIHTINAAAVPQESSHSNTNTYTNLNTITNTQDITFTINYNTAGNITWYKDGAPVKTDTGVTTSTVTTAWTSADYGQVKEMRVNSTTVDGTSTDTVWNVEVEETGTATITKNIEYPEPRIDGTDTLYITNG